MPFEAFRADDEARDRTSALLPGSLSGRALPQVVSAPHKILPIIIIIIAIRLSPRAIARPGIFRRRAHEAAGRTSLFRADIIYITIAMPAETCIFRMSRSRPHARGQPPEREVVSRLPLSQAGHRKRPHRKQMRAFLATPSRSRRAFRDLFSA